MHCEELLGRRVADRPGSRMRPSVGRAGPGTSPGRRDEARLRPSGSPIRPAGILGGASPTARRDPRGAAYSDDAPRAHQARRLRRSRDAGPRPRAPTTGSCPPGASPMRWPSRSASCPRSSATSRVPPRGGRAGAGGRLPAGEAGRVDQPAGGDRGGRGRQPAPDLRAARRPVWRRRALRRPRRVLPRPGGAADALAATSLASLAAPPSAAPRGTTPRADRRDPAPEGSERPVPIDGTNVTVQTHTNLVILSSRYRRHRSAAGGKGRTRHARLLDGLAHHWPLVALATCACAPRSPPPRWTYPPIRRRRRRAGVASRRPAPPPRGRRRSGGRGRR